METVKQDVQKLIDLSYQFAKECLIDYKEFYPFGFAIDNNGEGTYMKEENPARDFPQSQVLIDELIQIYQKRLDNNEIRAYALTYDVRVAVNDEGDKSDAISIDILHRDDKNLPIYYYPYSWSKSGELIFGENFWNKKKLIVYTEIKR